MLGRILKQWVGTDVPACTGRTPADTRIYAVGDVHGRLDLLLELRERIADDAARSATGRRLVVYLGDFVDRGLQSREVIDLLLDQPLAGFEEVHLRGNHEDVILGFLDDISFGPSWLRHGGRYTLLSYGIPVPPGELDEGELRRVQAALRRELPHRHVDFLRSLRYSHIEGDFFFVHAGVRPGVGLDVQHPEDLLWIRDEFLDSTSDYGKVVVHGHSISAEPVVRGNRIGIDTGAYFSGRLTGLVLDGAALQVIQT